MFGKSKKPKNEPAAKASKKKKGGLGSKLGKKIGGIEKVKTNDQQAVDKRHHDLIAVWQYVRYYIDVGATEYLTTGNPATLQNHAKGVAYDSIIERLNALKAQGLFIESPDRIAAIKRYSTSIVDERLDGDDNPIQFTVREVFPDQTIITSSDGKQEQAQGVSRTLQAVVDITHTKNGQDYQLVSVVRFKGAY